MSGSNLEARPALEAYKTAARNDLRRYPSPEKDGERLYPLASPSVRPGFSMSRSDTVFTIGSCFARNVESALASNGLVVLSREFELGHIGEGLGFAGNFFNKYSIHSIINEFRWAMDRSTFPGRDLLYSAKEGSESYLDLQLGSSRLDYPVTEILEFRHRFLDVMAQAAEADVLVVTLGYVEVWFDRKLDIYLNVAPPPVLAKREPERFEFRVLSYEDVLAGLREMRELLLKYRRKPLRMLLTVSPVPLLSTFRDMDVLVANSYSKSVQRAAIDAFVAETEGVDYFPSYEFVTLSDPRVAWSRGDYRHVSADLVARIMATVLQRYVEGESGLASPEAVGAQSLEASVRMVMKLGEFSEAVALMERNAKLVAGNGGLELQFGTALLETGRFEEAFDALARAGELLPNNPDPLEAQIQCCRKLGRGPQAEILLAEHSGRFPGRSEFREEQGWKGVL
ncbi:GSCFA domain-containing protein [Aliiruegeria sabulilitoris]|uniref:GSCFA domain-containing protein n=1 Tax=Aliiruegeria sabulilitoris TaxID=1510458 RepID=UPI00082C031E|nr:GSCFA domain-containing protein [Aliiruegeria sabulilitoris]NDR55286.1 tetratricopeptide repeat protein [Pseudoruegeria sp. M32A2M]